MDCIKTHDLIRRIFMAGICLLVIWPFLFGSGPLFAIEIFPDPPIAFSQDPNRETNKKLNTRIASNGQEYLCIWQEQNNVTGEDILGQIVDPNGALLGDIINISQFTGSQTNPDLDSDGSNYLVVWSDGRDSGATGFDIYAALVNNDRTISEEIPIETDLKDQKFPKVKWNGTYYLVAWEDWKEHDSSFKVSIYGKRVDRNGNVIDQEPKEIEVDYVFNEKGIRASFDLASLEDPNMDSWLIMWNGSLQDPSEESFDILGKFIDEDPNGDLFSNQIPIQIPIPSIDQYHPSVEGLSNGFLVVWENRTDEEGTDTDIWGVKLDANGNILSNIINVSSAPNKQTFPEVAKNGQGYLVVWLDRRDSQSDQVVEHVYGTRVSPEGFLLIDNMDSSGGTRISVSTDPNQTPWFPCVASTGSEDDRYFCVWSAGKIDKVWSINGRIYAPPPPPQLEWIGTSDYENDGVDPDSASGGSLFTFKVKYVSDEEIDAAPEIAQVWIDLDDNRSYGLEERFNMSGEGSSSYTEGRIYSYEVSKILYDGDGELAYRFFFMDQYNVATGEPTLDNTFEVNLEGEQPTLDWTDEPGFTEDGVRPDGTEWGDTKISFEFRVNYQDKDNNAPQNIVLCIDKNGDGFFDPNNEKWDMEAEADGTNYQEGQIYTKTIELASTIIRPIIYKFESDDGKNKAIGDPRAGSYLSFNPLGETSACLNTQYQFFPSITSTGSGYQVFWEDYRERELDANDVLVIKSHIWMELLSEDGQVKDGPDEPGQIRIDTSSKGAFKPLARFNPDTGYTLVIWEDLRNGSTRIPSKEDFNIFKPETIYKGLDIYGIFMDADGEPFIDANDPNSTGEFMIAGLNRSQNMLNPDMAMGANGQYIIVWEDESLLDSPEKTDIIASFVKYPEGVSGGRIGLQINVAGRFFLGEEHQLMPKVAWNGNYYLAVWQDTVSVDRETGYYFSRVYGIRIDPNGDTYHPEGGFKFFNDSDTEDLSDPNNNQLFPDVASDGENFLIVWQDSRSLGTKRGYDIYGMRVNINGLAPDYLDDFPWEIPICTANGHQIRPRVFWDTQANQYIIMWLEMPYELSPGDMLYHRMSFPYPRAGNIKVVRMDPNGQLIDSPPGEEDKYEGTSLIGVYSTQDQPDMVCDPNLGCRLIWEDFRNTYSYDLYTTSYQSTLNWTGDPNFEASGVEPITAKPGSTFTFKVEYRDRLNTPLKVSQVWIDLDDNGMFDPNERFDMEVADTNIPVSQGMIFTYAREIEFPQESDGSIAYRFYFQNTQDQEAQGIGSGLNFLSLKITEAPQLDWAGGTGFTSDGVNPDQGDTGSVFTFKVKYTDPSNIAPDVASVWIDMDDSGGESGDYSDYEKFPMTPEDPDDKDYSDGKIYTSARTISYRGDGIINYRFYFHNGAIEAVGEPTSDHTFQINEPPETYRWKIYYKEDGLGGNLITSVTVDEDNIPWVGTLPDHENPDTTGGVSRFNASEEKWETFNGTSFLPHNYILSLDFTQNNDLWIATIKGIVQYDGTGWNHILPDIINPDDPNSIIWSFASDKERLIWFTIYPIQEADGNISDSELIKYNSENMNKDEYSNRSKFGGNLIGPLAIDKDGMVWAGVRDAFLDPNGIIKVEYMGLAMFNPISKEVEKSFNSSEGNYPGGDFIQAIYADETGDLWVGSQDPLNLQTDYGVPKPMGLSRYNSEQWTQYMNGEDGVVLGSNDVKAIYRRGDDLYIGHYPESESLIGGATYHNLSTGGWEVLNSATEGIDTGINAVNDLVIDGENIVWFATMNGVYRFDPNGTLKPSPTGPVPVPYRGLFDPNEDTGCFINRIAKQHPGKEIAVIIPALVMCFFLIFIGFINRRQTINRKRSFENKTSGWYDISNDLEIK